MRNEAAAEPAPTHRVGLVGLVDRAFPLLWIGIYLLLPVSGWAGEMFESWFDQRRDLAALGSLLAEGRADAIADSVIGPAYIAAAALVHEVFGLSPEDSLVVLTRVSYVLAVAAGLVLVRVLVARTTGAPAIVSIGAQLAFLGLVFAAGTWYWSDVPWSHFFAAFLAVALYAVRFAPSPSSVAWAALAGALLALLAATRTFELVAVVLAWILAAVVFWLLRPDATWKGSRVLAGAAAFVVTTGAVYLATDKREPFFLYENHLDRQSGSVPDVAIAETPTLSLALVPVKLVQLVVDPCYLSLCETSDYETRGGGGQNVDLWSLPLAIQLPALLLLPLCVVGVCVLAVRARRSPRRDTRASGARPLVEMTIAATGLVLGYAASTLSGPSHLRYGFARDFLLPATLLAVVAVVLGSALLWGLLERRGRRRRLSSEVAFVGAAFVLVVGVVAATTVARTSGLPRFESRHLGEVVYSASCGPRECAVSARASTTAGEAISIPEPSTLTFGCGTNRARLTVYVDELGAVDVPPSCPDPRLVAAWPTVMGLPPGSLELAAVDVRNA